MPVGVFDGLAFLAAYDGHSGLTSLGFFGMAALGFGLFGMAGYVIGAVEAATAARRQRRAMERMGGLRLERDESFDPAIPSQAVWTDSRPV